MFNYTVGKPKEFKRLVAGNHNATIKNIEIQDVKPEYVSAELKGYGVKPQRISILLETDTGETGYDTINQTFDKETFTMVWATWKFDKYSHAVNIPEGTVFNTIEDWFNYLKGKRVNITVEINDRDYPVIKEIESAAF